MSLFTAEEKYYKMRNNLKKAFKEFAGTLNGLLDKEQTVECYYRACDYCDELLRWIPSTIEDEFDIIAEGETKINITQFLNLVNNILAQFGL